MLSLLVAYTTHDGHTAKIAERIAAALRSANCAVEVCDLARSRSERSLEGYDGVIAGGPLHGGGDTDTSRNYVYTDWEALDRFAHELARDWTSRETAPRESALA